MTSKRVVPEPEFLERVKAMRESFGRQAFMTTLGAELETVDPGAVTVRLPTSPELTQQNGYVHAGAVTSIADSACGYAAFTLMPRDSDVLSVEFKVNLLRPAEGPVLVARAHVLRAGRTLSVCQADVFTRTGAEERHVATMICTIMRIIPAGTAKAETDP